jgi:hypothetical protein
MTRGLGRTTQQMQDAPVRALYVVDDKARRYMLGLSMSLGRGDLQIVTVSDLESSYVRGLSPSGVVLDHGAPKLTPLQQHRHCMLVSRAIFKPIHEDAW